MLKKSICFRFAAGKSDKEILDNLLKNSRYDKRLLPPVDGKYSHSIPIVLVYRCGMYIDVLLNNLAFKIITLQIPTFVEV